MITLPPPTWLEVQGHSAFRAIQRAMRRIDPFFRPAFNSMLREPLASAVQWAMNARRRDQGLQARRRARPTRRGTKAWTLSSRRSPPTCGRTIGRASISAAATRRHMVSCAANSSSATTCLCTCGTAFSPNRHTYRSWVRFSGPGPDMPKDIEDVGFVSCAIKLMGVPGPKTHGR